MKSFGTASSSREVILAAQDARGGAWVLVRRGDSAAGGAAGGGRKIRTYILAMAGCPAVEAGFSLTFERVATKKGGPVSNPKGDHGAAEKDLYKVGIVETFSIEDLKGWVVSEETVQDAVGGFRERDVEDHPSGGVRWGWDVVGQGEYGAIERKRRERKVSLGAVFRRRAYDNEVGAVVDTQLILGGGWDTGLGLNRVGELGCRHALEG